MPAKKELRFRAKQRMENIAEVAGLPDKEYPEGSSWVVGEGRVVAGDHPALALHPDMFEELE
jgi:hypothetical protein